MKKLIFITNNYPFYPGEQFIEDEIIYWSKQKKFQVTILPLNNRGVPRKVPKNIKVDNTLVRNSKLNLIPKLLLLPFEVKFYKEIFYLLYKGKLNFKSIRALVIDVSKYLWYQNKIKSFIRENDGVEVIYSYWNNLAAFAAVTVKNNTNNIKVVSRIHGADLYEERKSTNHLSLKRQFINSFDCIYCLSDTAKSYLIHTFNAKDKIINVARLGVPVNRNLVLENDEDLLHIVSCSFCVPIKRIDKIIQVIELYAQKKPDDQIFWTHIGGGPLFDSFHREAENKLNELKNVEYSFLGTINNSAVKSYYRDNNVSVFINLSETEGIPVSIMEAMAYGVPAIAPDIGGIASLINKNNGYLLDKNAEIEDAVKVLCEFSEMGKEKKLQIQKNAQDKIANNFNSEINYKKIVKDIFELTIK